MLEHPVPLHFHHCVSYPCGTTLYFCFLFRLKPTPACVFLIKVSIFFAQKNKYTHHMFAISPCFIRSLEDNDNRKGKESLGRKGTWKHLPSKDAVMTTHVHTSIIEIFLFGVWLSSLVIISNLPHVFVTTVLCPVVPLHIAITTAIPTY